MGSTSDRLDAMLEAAPEPVELPDYQRIIGPLIASRVGVRSL
jgi:hypothetical protein